MKRGNLKRVAPLLLAACAFVAGSHLARADVVIGDFEGGSMDGWSDWRYNSIDATFSHDTFGTTLGASSLKVIPNQNFGQHLTLKLQERDLIGAFLTSGQLAIDLSFREADYQGTGTYSLIELNFNSRDSGFDGQGRPDSDTGNPGFFGGWDPTNFDDNTRTITWDLRTYIDGDVANDETSAVPSNVDGGWLELILQTAYDVNFDPSFASFYFDNIRLLPNVVNSTWTNASGTTNLWYSSRNWAGGVAGVTDAVANFNSNGGAITTAQTVDLNRNASLGGLNFDLAAGYAITGTGVLTFDVSTGSASVNVAAGNHSISNAITLQDSVAVFVNSAGSTLTLSGGVSGPTHGITKAGPGTLAVSTLNVGNVSVDAGTLRVGSGLSRITGVSVATGGSTQLNLGAADTALIVDYSSTSPLADIGALIASGRNGGAWNGNGITSTAAASNSALGIGYAERSSLAVVPALFGAGDATQVLLRITLKGDANLDGAVNFNDLLLLAKNYNLATGATWVQGDADYNGAVTFNDLLALAKNYNQSIALVDLSAFDEDFASDFALAVSLVPEPSSALLGLSAASLLRRRRRL